MGPRGHGATGLSSSLTHSGQQFRAEPTVEEMKQTFRFLFLELMTTVLIILTGRVGNFRKTSKF